MPLSYKGLLGVKQNGKDFRRNPNTNPKQEAIDKPLLLFKRRKNIVNRTIGAAFILNVVYMISYYMAIKTL